MKPFTLNNKHDADPGTFFGGEPQAEALRPHHKLLRLLIGARVHLTAFMADGPHQSVRLHDITGTVSSVGVMPINDAEWNRVKFEEAFAFEISVRHPDDKYTIDGVDRGRKSGFTYHITEWEKDGPGKLFKFDILTEAVGPKEEI